jgi:hypothetical protein
MKAKHGWITACAAAAMLAPGLAACAAGSGETSAQPVNNNSAAPPASSSPADSGNTGDSGNSGGHSGLTRPGAHLALGTAAVVGWVPPSIDLKSGSHKGIKLLVTVESIQKGTIADFKNVELNASEKKDTPYYVKVRVKALTGIAPPKTEDPDVTFDAIDDRGQEQSSVTFFGTFERCNDNTVPKHFVSGKSYESCLTYLMPGGGSIQAVQWNNGPNTGDVVSPYFDKPIVWGGS